MHCGWGWNGYAAPMGWHVEMMSVVLLFLAALHGAWGIGFWWPIREESELVRAVIGLARRSRMPGALACSAVAVALLGAASCLWWPEGLLRDLALAALGMVFCGRGALAYAGPWRRMLSAEPFATLDRWAYGPLCLALGLGFWAEAAPG